MRYLVKTLLFCFLLAGSAQAADSLEIAALLAQSGAPQLALVRVEHDQPGRTDVQQWLRWEPLHLSLLNALNRPAEVLERIAALPTGMSAEVAQPAYWQGARAALLLGKGEQARGYLSRLLWQFELAEPQYKEARRLVIQSYLQERRADGAYRAMLRYGQDFQPLPQRVATAFTEAMLTAGAKAEAGTWLAALDESSPLKLLVRLKSGMITPEQAVAAARAALNPADAEPSLGKLSKVAAQKLEPAAPLVRPKTADPAPYWAIIMQAAAMRENAALQAEAREHLLNLQDQLESMPPAIAVNNLWQSYFALALQHSNQAQLLLGDDAAWFRLGEQLQDSSPVAARALFAYLTVRAGEQALRESAQAKLATSLLLARLELAAVRLFSDDAHFPENRGLLPQVRFALGEAAVQCRDYVRAIRFWRGLTQPFGEMPLEEWQLKRARAFVYGGAYAEAEEAVRMLPVAASSEQREILFALGELAEIRGEAATAAGHFLQAAAQADDAMAQWARRQAARNMVRAGLTEDARKQYLMLLQTTQDASQQAAIRRALARL